MLEVSLQQNRVQFSGQLNRDTVVAHWPFQVLRQLSGEIIFDLSGIHHADTAGLAWLLQVIATARSNQQQVVITQLPEQLQRLASVSAVLDLLPVRNS